MMTLHQRTFSSFVVCKNSRMVGVQPYNDMDSNSLTHSQQGSDEEDNSSEGSNDEGSNDVGQHGDSFHDDNDDTLEVDDNTVDRNVLRAKYEDDDDDQRRVYFQLPCLQHQDGFSAQMHLQFHHVCAHLSVETLWFD